MTDARQHANVNTCNGKVVLSYKYAAIAELNPAKLICVNPATGLALPARSGNKLTATEDAIGSINDVEKNIHKPGTITNAVEIGSDRLAATELAAAHNPIVRPETIVR